ncbi:nucleobase:cation symporter-2 family protein [Candidatus Formimonas warabiya]|uniref:Xanthine permease n=1 Tax=Formimonas warabiya TaxID=1761012 RepID=A0A3G1KQB7_FORW1|nr:nucleobase:cation symporter-2 family protein [Candidatus Formimonas warabiya]ATW24630.1 xanthine permease [Candidatus Formimonas warabiya]
MSDVGTNTEKVNEMLPIGQLSVLGLQHVLAMYAGAVTIPIIIAGALGLTQTQLALLIAADLFTCGIATFIQSYGIGNFAGIKLPVVLGVTFTAVGPLIAIGSESGILGIWGSIIISGLFMILFAPLYGKLLRFFPQVVTGSIVTIIGFSLIPIGMQNVAGGVGSPTFGAPVNLCLALLVMCIIMAVNKFFRGFFQAISVLIGIILGTIVAGLLGMVDFKVVADANWVSIVQPLNFGMPKITVSGTITMCLVAIVTMIESTGVFLGIGKICDKEILDQDIVKGIRAEGIATILGGILNSFPYTTYSQNMGLVALTKVTTRWVTVVSGIILFLLGILPKFAALATIIPAAVLGGAMIVMFGMVGVSGIKMLTQADLTNNNNLLIAATSIGVGLGISVVTGIFDQMPALFKTFIGSGIVSGTIVAVLLNIFLNLNENDRKADSNSGAGSHFIA